MWERGIGEKLDYGGTNWMEGMEESGCWRGLRGWRENEMENGGADLDNFSEECKLSKFIF